MSVVLMPAQIRHFEDTVVRPVDLGEHPEVQGDELEMLRRTYGGNTIPLWGVAAGISGQNIRTWAAIQPGDVALFYAKKKFFAAGRITQTFVNRALATSLWGTAGENQETWEYLVALAEIEYLTWDVAEFNRLMNYSEQATVQRLRLLDSDRSAIVLEHLQGLGKFVSAEPDAEDSDDLSNEDENVGAESEADVGHVPRSYLREAYVTGSDWTTSTLIDQLRRGNIDLNPRFQRREVWQPIRKSGFIESVLLNFPVPQIVLAEVKGQRGRYIVLDGKQRLLTLRQFCSDPIAFPADASFNKLSLRGLKLRPDLNGKDYGDLRSEPGLFDDLDAFDNSTIRTVVVRNWQVDDYLYLVFLRLNTESVALSPQELRQALKPGRFTDYVDERAVDSTSLRSALNQSGPDFRMRDTEMLLRAVSFHLRPEAYRGNLKEFLDATCEIYNETWGEESSRIESAVTSIESAIDLVLKIFGPRVAFSRYVGETAERRFNRAIFDVLVNSLAQAKVAQSVRENPESVVTNLQDLCNHDQRFLTSITSTTKSLNATAYRFVAWAESLETRLGVAVVVPGAYRDRVHKAGAFE